MGEITLDVDDDLYAALAKQGAERGLSADEEARRLLLEELNKDVRGEKLPKE